MIEYLLLILAIPLGILTAKITKDEKNIYNKPQYFPTMIWAFTILSAIFLTLNKTIGITLAFLTILTFTWMKTK
ncbi:MAG: hypothetical protein ABIF88_02840 [archaeon]